MVDAGEKCILFAFAEAQKHISEALKKLSAFGPSISQTL